MDAVLTGPRLGRLVAEGWSSYVHVCLDHCQRELPAVVKVAKRNVPGIDTPYDRVHLRTAWRREHAALVNVRTVSRVPRLLASGWGRRPWLMMSHVEGRRCDQVAPMALDEAVDVGLQLAAILRAIHSLGWLHLDLNPGNVILSRGTVTLVDFGAAQRLGRPSQWSWPLGRHRFMAPEHLDGRRETPRYRRIGPASDVHQLASLLLYLVSGREPFEPCRPAENYRSEYLFRLAEFSRRPGRWKAEKMWGGREPAPLIAAFTAGLEPDPRLRCPDPSSFMAAVADAARCVQ